MKRDFESFRERYLPQIEKHLGEFLVNQKAMARVSTDMTSYHLETGGKRVRALIPLFVYRAFGREKEIRDAIALGAAVEMIHNATLVHDDLQDGDEIRRGRPTVWKKFSVAQAINCGDAMFQYATLLLAQMKIEPERLVKLISYAADSTVKVIEGQAQEFLMKEENHPTIARYLGVIRGKTSGLFNLPIVGAIQALGVDQKAREAVERAAIDLGMLFQIQDDVLDIYGEKGRDRPATDVAEGKISIFVAHVNEVGSAVDKAELSRILRKPREQTTDSDTQRAIAIFERYDAKGMAVGYIRNIQRTIAEDEALKCYPELRGVLLELGELFLEPVHGIL